MLLNGGLVFLMQAGFMCLESGFTRAKNSINVAIKNLTDFLLSMLLFWGFGFGLMFGMTYAGWVGVDSMLLDFDTIGPWQTAFFFFQTMFCATAATIVSGAIAERIRFDGYIVVTCIISGIIYPLYGHWAWNGADGRSDGGWLMNMGFVDFAGSTVVHSVGGWVALAALFVLGPRTGRFGPKGEVNTIHGYNIPLSVLGCLLLYMGWFGFNGGSTLALNDGIAKIIANTSMAGAAGGLAALFVGWPIRKRPDVGYVVNGSLAGLVAITAGCHAVSAPSAVAIGAIGAVVMIGLDRLLERLKIDDAVGAVPVHLGAGVWGTFAVALFGQPDALGKGLSMAQQAVVQGIGIATAGVWAFGVALILLWIFNRIFPLRVSIEAEKDGLNFSEHGATTELVDLLNAMEAHGRTGELSERVPVEPFTEVGQIAQQYNRVIDLLQRVVLRSEAIIRDIGEGIITFAEGGVMTSLNPGAEKLFASRRLELVGQPVTALFAIEAGGAGMGLDRMLLWGTRPEGATVWACRKDQSRFPADIRVSRTELGGATSYTVLVKDITERRRAEEALRASRTRMQRHNEALASLATLLNEHADDFETLVAGISKSAVDTLGINAVTVWRHVPGTGTYTRVAETFADGPPDADAYLPPLLLDPDTGLAPVLRQVRVTQVGDVTADPRVADLRPRYLAPRGVTALLAAQLRLGGEAWGVALFEHSRGKRDWHPEELVFAGSVTDVFAMALETAERRRAEEEVLLINEELEKRVEQRTLALRQSNAELQDAMERIEKTQNHLVTVEKMAALGELVAGVAHEINTPVGVAVTGASYLKEQTRKVAEAFESGQLKKSELDSYIKLAHESSRMLMNNLERAAELVQSFKKVAVDQSSEDKRPFRVVEYTNEVLLSLRPRIKKTRVEVMVEGPEDLEVESYPGLFSQIITNLIMNSLTHAYEPGETGQILLHYELSGESLIFTYTDNGKGIPPEIISRIFDPFFTTRRGRGGSGLGLHILYNIISGRLGGDIDCQSEVGKGTTFRMNLPINANRGSAHGL